MKNLFDHLPKQSEEELFETILSRSNVRIERIFSDGQTTPEGQWYDQAQSEWVLVLQGTGELEFIDGTRERLSKGDYRLIEPHEKHRVSYTAPSTLWLAVHFD